MNSFSEDYYLFVFTVGFVCDVPVGLFAGVVNYC